MKKIVLFAPVLIASSVVFAAACNGGPADEMDGSGGTDGDGTGGNTPSGGSPNSTGGSPNNTGGTAPSGGQPNLGGMGGMGGFGGLGGFGGAGDDALLAACETMCATAVAGDASACDEADCVQGCAYTYAAYYEGLGCDEEYLALKECSAELDGSEFVCVSGTVGANGCTDEQNAVADCYN